MTQKSTPEFQQSIIDLYHSGTSASQLTKGYGVSVTIIYKWTNKNHTDPSKSDIDGDIKKLERRTLKAKSEVDTLKNP